MLNNALIQVPLCVCLMLSMSVMTAVGDEKVKTELKPVLLVMDVQNWNWMNYPLDWTRGFALDHLGSFALLGIVTGAILKPRRPDFEA